MSTSSTAVIVVAAGAGRRMGAPVNKVFLPLGGRPILARTLDVLEAHPAVRTVVLVTATPEMSQAREEIVEPYGFTKVGAIVAGGASRQESEYLGLEALAPSIESGAIDLVMVHDAVRPFVLPAEISRLATEARSAGAAILAVPAPGSVVERDGEGHVAGGAAGVWAAQTPQAFAAGLLLGAHRAAAAAGTFEATDTAAVVELVGHPVRVVEGRPENIKITTAADLGLAELIVRQGGRVPLGRALREGLV
jgi:2-C-methyl-D-erythritol 4-phosphate cytidylyltransferase